MSLYPFILISVITFLGFLDTSMLLPVMSLYASRVGAGVGMAGLVIGMYSITNTPASVGFGRLIDRVGYKVPLVIGLLGDAVAIFLYSVVSSPLPLALLRAWHGISGGLVGPATMSAIASISSSSGRGKAMGVYGVAMALAMLVGFGASGLITERFSYQALFWTGSGLVALAALLAVALPQAPRPAVRAAVAGKPRTQVLELVRRKGLVTAYACIFAQYFTFGSVITLLPQQVREAGLGASHFGMMMAVFAIVFIVVQLRSGHMSDRIGRYIPTMVGLVMGAASAFGLSLVHSLGAWLGMMAVFGVAFGLLFPSISALVADNTAAHERGTGTGLFHAMLTAGVAIGAPVMGWVGETLGLQAGLMLTPAVFVLALAVTVGTRGRGKSEVIGQRAKP